MGKGRPRAVEKGVPGHSSAVSSSGALNIPQAPVFYPTEEEFKDPLEFIYKIRPEAEPYGICRIVPPKSWKPPFALDLESFTFPTKTQAIHQLQARVAACDPKTFELEYNRFLEYHSGKRQKKRVVFEGEELDLCKLFNAVKRYGGYDKVVKEKKWAEVFRFVRSVGKISECSKHVLCQLYREHLYDYEVYHSQSNHDKSVKRYKKGICGNGKSIQGSVVSSSKKRRRNSGGERTKVGTLEKQDDLDQICEQCRSGLHGEVMLLCDRCNKGWHIYCLSPPLKKVPPGNWYCLECVNSDKDSFGFVPGKHFSLDAFRRLADRAKRKWFGSACVSRLQIEKRFWEIVEGSVGEVEVLYGSDLDTSIYGSGFPRVNDPRPTSVEVEVWNEYCASPWNLNNLPKLQGSVLRAVHHNIAGVMVPWLYIGMLFSSFCWHFEDHCFYSMNYLHWGEPKCWYSVPGSEAHSFEQVMKNCLPDLFDAQPDLLFQLVTMLNPSVLQENGVPVYSVLQEPGNFVITFPRSYHGGFNFGLNCAEAVNFAPADWLPHGGFGAELYRSYHKAAVLSHEELLYVVAKGDCGSKVSPFLKKELLRVFSKEKTWRERLWRDGIICTSPMTPRRHPEYVGTEEDPSCIICQQYLFLSAVVCSCRPSAFVCLEHWEHLCECSPSKHRLLYRHTLAELNDLVLMLDKCNLEESPQNRTIRKHLPSSNESNSVMKKIRGGHATHVQLAEQWVLNSHKILQAPFSSAAYVNALKDAEQFLWGGSEMDQVRNMAKNLIEARKWAEEVINCLSKVETCLHHCKNDIGKVSLGFVENLLNYDPLPCNEPGYFKLKAYAEDARILVGEIESALSISSHVSIAHLGKLYSRASELPVYVEESTKLAGEISSAKVWSESVRQCITEKRSAAVDIDVLYKLKSEMLELRVELPETELLLDLLRNMESWQIRCSEILKGPISLKELEVLLQELNHFSICVPELKLLRQYHNDAVTWISHFHDFIVNARGREDQKCVVQELTCILEAGKLLRVQVDELPFVEEELKKACCREKALQACATKMPLDFIEEVIAEAVMLQIDNENIFVDVSRVLAAASSWEERSKHILGSKAQMSEFEDAIRISGTIFAILPSLNDIEHALSMAKSWISNSQPFLLSSLSAGQASSSSLKVDALKDLVAQSKFLKVDLQEPAMLLNLLNDCEAWQNDACTLLECTTALYSTQNIDIGVVNDLTVKIEKLLTGIKSATTAGLSLGFDFYEIPKLQNTSCILQWCLKAFSFCSGAPLLEDVERLMKDSENLCATFASSCLGSVLIKGARWLWEALSVFPHSSTQRRCKLSDVEEVLEETQRIEVPFPIVAARLVNAIEKHKSWQEQVHAFFNSKFGEQSWSVLVQLKELGESNAFSCPELDLVASEINKVENWFLRCKNIIGPLVYGVNPLLNALIKIKHTLDGSLYIYGNSKNCEEKAFCACCCSDVKEESIACVTCKDCYHPSCLISTDSNTSAAKEAICPFCLFMESGTVPRNGDIPLISKGKRPELNMLIELSNAAKDLHLRIDEKDMIQQLVEKALACKACLSEIVDSALAHSDKDLRSITEKLLIALKAVSMAGIYDKHGSCNLELAIERNKWKIRVKKLLENSQKPLIQQIHRLWKEGLAISIPSEDQFMKKLVEVKSIGMIWADRAKKVAMDSGALGLDKVFKLITEGENLPVYFEKELKLLRARSALHCICRKPYDQRAMIACNRCDEWYHFDCVNLHPPPPKTYLCPACEPCSEEAMPLSAVTKYEERLNGFNDGGPRTPPPRLAILRKRNPKKVRSNLQRKILVASDLSDILRCSSEIDYLWWRNRKPLRRTARKRARLDSLSSFLHI
ncbi:PREDICTED: lysine-specific demethylase 5B isoform X2 [Nelumbo nucifera]|uniref:Lysine-specific demethylase 5B isoform X2 n=1 Tax=Nelumbo nucifera TaxID=4432 RepID=A0A1U8A2L3_NELNU|nr:PREDICTED: lysine-specific demethylase 5B isoform X2 [Nelumbo nucifera]